LAFEGPGCSSIGYGAAVEIGPLIVNKNGEGLNFNPYSWHQGLNFSILISIFFGVYAVFVWLLPNILTVLKSTKKGRL